jgi:hypothetical protein
MGSRLENISDEQIKKYMKYVYKIIGDIEFDGPNELYHYDNLSSLFSPFGGGTDRLDIEYLYYLLKKNPFYFKEGYPINRPTLVSDFGLNYRVKERQVVVIDYSGEIETYIPDDLESDYLFDITDDRVIDPYTWDTDSEVIDSDEIEDSWEF